MSATIKISLDAEAQKIAREVREFPAEMQAGMARALDRENMLTVSHIQQAYLSFPKDGPAVPMGCRVQTNRLRGSLRAAKAAVSGNVIASSIGSNVVYAAAQEFGFEGEETVRAHTRNVKGTQIGVRSFTRRMNLPGRGFVRRGIADRAKDYTDSISAAIVKAWEGNGN